MANGAENANTDGTHVQAKLDEQSTAKNKKQSVLETHGYTIGRSVGSGAYATVKVTIAKIVLLTCYMCTDVRLIIVVSEQ